MTRLLPALAAILAAMPLSGCLHVPPSYGPMAGDCLGQTADPAGAKDPVYFVTTGQPLCNGDQPLALTVERGSFRPYGTPPPEAVRYGLATPGTPILPKLALADNKAWHTRLRQDLQAPRARMLFYVHGYNNSPSEALSAADQVALAARFDGPVVAFLWPSQHSLTKYTWDEENARWTQAYFDAVLADLAAQAPELVLVSHSMGNRIAIDGLRHLQSTAPALAARIKTVVLAAPDVDRELFDRDLAPDIVRPGRRITLFASGGDLPLETSWAMHGSPRAGDVRCALNLRRPKLSPAERCYPMPRGGAGEMTVVDSSDIPGKPFGHGNHIETPEGRAVLRAVLAAPATSLPAKNGVLVLEPAAAPDCASGQGRLKMVFNVVRCSDGKRRSHRAAAAGG